MEELLLPSAFLPPLFGDVSVNYINIGNQKIMDFLTFKSFISTEALILFYYIGALILPIGIWILFKWLIRKYRFLNTTYENGKEMIWQSLNKKQQIKLVTLFIFCFLFMELFWRMLFEFLIAYMQIRDALLSS